MPEEKPKSPSFYQLLKSTLWAAIGVQSDKNRAEDFSNTSPVPYIIAGLLFTIVFIFSLVAIVSFVLKDSL